MEQAPEITANEELNRIKDALQLEASSRVQVVDLEAEDRLKRKRQRSMFLSFAAVAALLTASIVAAVVATQNKDEPTETPTIAPTIAPTSRMSALEMLVVDKFGELPDDPYSPQRRAIVWMTNEDEETTFPLELDDDDEYGFFYDRYASIVLAFSTNYGSWINNEGWLNVTSSVCEGWVGLT